MKTKHLMLSAVVAAVVLAGSLPVRGADAAVPAVTATTAAAPAEAALPGAYLKGMELFKAFKNKEAIPLFETAAKQAPQSVEVRVRLTYAYNNTGEDLDNKESEPYYAKAVASAEELMKMAPDRAESYFLLSMCYGNLALFKGGKEKVRLSRNIEQVARKGTEIDPKYSNNYAVLGVYYREVALLNPVLRTFAKYLLGGLPSGTLEMAEQNFSKSIELDTTNVYGTYQLAATYEKMRQPDKAIALYKKVLAMPVGDHRDPFWRDSATKRLEELKGK